MRYAGTAPGKVLLVDSRGDQRATLGRALADAGYEVAMAPSGSVALTMLGDKCPDLVVSCAKVQDMDAYELFTRVRKDPGTADTPFLLLAGRDRPTALAAAEAGVNLILSGDFTAEMVVGRVADLMKDMRSAEAGRPVRRIAPASARKTMAPLWAALDTMGPRPVAPPGPASFQGSLGVMDLAEITQAIALGGKTGCLAVLLSAGEGTMLFDAGRLVHATFAGSTGEAAFAALVQISQYEVESSFCFNQAERAELARLPRTISRSVDQLLLSIAASIDEGRTGAGENRPVGLATQKEG